MDRKLRVSYYGSYDLSEPHNTTYLRGLQAADVEVIECRSPIVDDRDAAEQYKSVLKIASLLFRYLKNSVLLFFKFLRLKNIDAIMVGYPGYFDLFSAKVLSALRRIPLIFNVHISLYETLVVDRKYFSGKSIIGKSIKLFDWLLFKLADVILVDTDSHADYFSQLYRLPRKKFERVYIGADEIFQPANFQGNGKFTVLFYGTFIPLQGIEFIVAAADLLQDEKNLRFKMIGRGQKKEQIVKLANDLKVKNIDFVDWVTREELVKEISKSDICLGGQFGLTEKADLVIGYKCFQMIAMRKPVVVADSQGNKELLQDGVNCVFSSAGDSESLAQAVLRLKHDDKLRAKVGNNARATFDAECSAAKIGSDLKRIIENSITNNQ